jgi:polar amino acid transport system substrate-binding protein
MKQILQNIKTGKLNVAEVPEPGLAGPGVLVATQASVISAGTERMITDFAQKSLIGKAKARPDQVKLVIDKIKRDGLKATLHSVFSRLSQPMPLGYSASGIVIAKSAEVTNINAGDKVACGGAGHAEVIFVPKNLAVPVPENVDFDSAAFATLGSIAMQAVRVAELVVGEKVAVIGLGLLGLITIQLAKAAGCRVIGADVNPERIKLAEKLACDRASTPDRLAEVVAELTGNIGVDAVIIAAATKSNQPTELAAAVSRKKGRISVVGAVKMDIPRGPFYEKELQLRLSTSYGPGRYDREYEEKGHDYPYAYVPWTEQRNMACVLDLISQGKLDVQSLITHRFGIEQAEEAYKLVRGEIQEPYLGIVLNYPKVEERQPTPIIAAAQAKPHALSRDKVGIGIIGAGVFANITMLPAMKKISDYGLVGIADVNGSAAKHAQDKFGFAYSTGDHRKIMEDDNIDVVFVTTRHNTHASLLIEALQAGKNVMVEKPLCMNEDELCEIIKAVEERPSQLVMVGFNRRFAPLSVELKKRFKDKGPLCMNYICNAGFVPKESWVQDIETGGGRIIGEACHFIDWMIWLTESPPVQVYAQSITKETTKALKEDNVMISLKFADGSIGTVSYLACGDKSFTKEHIEVYSGGAIGIIDDFRRGLFTDDGRREKLSGASKGHLQEWQGLADAIKNSKVSPITFEDIVASTWTTLKVTESLRTAKAIKI